MHSENESVLKEVSEFFSRVGKILVFERPEGMSMEAYRYIRKRQNEGFKKLKSGRLMHVSTEITFDKSKRKIVRKKTFFKKKTK